MKVLLPFRQIHFSTWRNTFSIENKEIFLERAIKDKFVKMKWGLKWGRQLKKYALLFRHINFAIWTNYIYLLHINTFHIYRNIEIYLEKPSKKNLSGCSGD